MKPWLGTFWFKITSPIRRIGSRLMKSDRMGVAVLGAYCMRIGWRSEDIR